jgi:hypothetical protein
MIHDNLRNIAISLIDWVLSVMAWLHQLCRLLALRSVSVVDYFRIAHNLGIRQVDDVVRSG